MKCIRMKRTFIESIKSYSAKSLNWTMNLNSTKNLTREKLANCCNSFKARTRDYKIKYKNLVSYRKSSQQSKMTLSKQRRRWEYIVTISSRLKSRTNSTNSGMTSRKVSYQILSWICSNYWIIKMTLRQLSNCRLML